MSNNFFQDLLKFVEEAEHGVIYVSFGSVVKSSTMPADKLNAVLEAMTELPQRFIWKWETDVVLLDKKKLYISSWLPQVDILGKHIYYSIVCIFLTIISF